MAKSSMRDNIAFWILGLSNNYAFVIMLSAANDIISRQSTYDSVRHARESSVNSSYCEEAIVSCECNQLSVGAVLLADILPSLVVKLLAPFFMHRIPFGFRHFIVCSFQAASFVIVAYSSSIKMSLLGVCFAAAGAGLGETSYLSLSAHYSKTVISFWSSGTGGAGIVGAFAYATLTEPRMIGLEPRQALLLMLLIPIIFAIAYWMILTPSSSIHRMNIFKINTWIVPKQNCFTANCLQTSKVGDIATVEDFHRKNNGAKNYLQNDFNSSQDVKRDVSSLWPVKSGSRLYYIKPLSRYMVPLIIVYFAEYLINQGVVELFVFDCSHGFFLSKSSQYRWYQVLYQVGVFISRSSVNVVELSTTALYLLPLFQMLNLTIFFFNAIYSFIPHILIIFVFILFEGFFGGASYVNTFNRIHKEAPPEAREFCLSVATLSDSFGTMAAGFSAFPLHNFICSKTL